MEETIITTPQAKDWDQYWSLDQTKRFTKLSWSKKRIMNVLSQYIRPGAGALDAGCGSGFFSKYFCDQGLNTYSLDYAEEALAIAKQMTNGRSHVIKEDLISASVPKQIAQRFDIIFTDGLLEHFSSVDQDKIMTNLKTLLKAQGVIITFVPNRWSPWELIRPLYMPGIEEKPFVLSQLIQLHERNGFSILQRGGVNTFPFAFSPDKIFGSLFGMLLFVVAKKDE